MPSNFADLERASNGWWTRKRSKKTKPMLVLSLALIGTFIYCVPAAWKYDQGLNHVDAQVIADFENGTCKRMGNNTVACSYGDKDTIKKWALAMEAQSDYWKERAGEPTAILTKVCKDESFIDADCPRILYAMAMQESYFGKAMIGDGGRSEGYFHILDIHKDVTKACKRDLECSARFTLERMVRYGFATDRNRAIMAHNGTPGIPATLAYLTAVRSKMKLFPN